MVIGQSRRAVGVFPTRQDAERAMIELRDAGFNMDKVSVIAQNTGRSNDMAGASLSDAKEDQIEGGTKAGAIAGGTTGSLVGLIGSLGVLAIPGVGPVAEVGILLANALLGGAIGAATGGLAGALIGWGVPEDRAKYYDERVSSGEYLVLVEGTEAEIGTAQAVLSTGGIRDWDIYDAPSTSPGDRLGVL